MAPINKITVFALIILMSSSCERLLIQPDQEFAENTVQFSENYVNNNSNTIDFEMPKLYELIQIAVSFTKYSMAYPGNITNITTPYYLEMKSYFEPFKNHELIKKLNTEVNSISADYRICNNSYVYEFNDQNSIVHKKIYPYIWEGLVAKNTFKLLMPLLEDYAKKSNFISFYNGKKSYYESIVTKQKVQMPALKMKNWLEARFPNRYNSLKIIFSPLTGGNHSTRSFETSNFNQILMFVSFPTFDSKFLDTQKEGLASRIVFTEIDHNYVNPISEKYLDKLKESVGDWQKWNNVNGSSKSYSSAFLTFNEYMTWAIFTLYAYDNFNKVDFEVINNESELVMSNRGFLKYKSFNKELLKLYIENPKISVDEIYLKMFGWMKTQ